ncbi:MAG: SIS domain-containing protein [Pyrinomonadaceae bacterium]
MTPKTSLDFHERVREILEIEAASIRRAAENLNPADVARALELLMSCKGKIVVTGVGKSGVIAQKISQTLTSTGTPAVFIHPSDALHGGLGVVAGDDLVIALSNSGETDELLAIMPSIRQRACKVISIIGSPDSTLGTRSDVMLDASVEKEACPLNLAPTASTTVALAIGDAVAMTLMEAKGLTQDEFAINHPAGQLGKRLTISVRDLMHPSPDITPDATWLEVVHAISRHALGAVNVVDGDSRLIGIVTDGDLRRTIERTSPDQFGTLTASDMMTASPTTTTPQTLAYDALRMMEERPSQIAVLPVLDVDGKAVGLLRLHDIVRSGIA